jgi:ParB family chromosome partitioning protein
MGKSNLILELPIADVFIAEGRRGTDPEKVQALAESIRELGQLQPIIVDEDYQLIAGRHRIDACLALGWKTIRAIPINLVGLQAELAEIDENLVRAELPQALYGIQLARRKEIYEALHPGAKRGAAGNAAQGKNDLTARTAVRSFVADTAEKTGKSQRTIRKDVAVGEKLDGEAVDDILNTPVADNKSELKALSELPPEQQRTVAKKIKSGEVKSVKEPPKTEPAKVLDAKKRPVPKDLIPIFETAGEFKAIARDLSSILKRAEVLAHGPAGAFLEYGSLRTDIENAKSAIKFGTPYIVCTYCRGTGHDCKPCRGSGYLNQSPTTRNEEVAA